MRPFRLLALPLLTAALLPALRADDPPRLAVVISLDQFRADYLPRFRQYFSSGGFRLLLDNGADYQECHHRHAVTKTAPGHATLMTGVYADVHGIVGNDWLDRTNWSKVTSAEDPDSPLVGAMPGPQSPGGLLEAQAGRSPRHLLATTVGDQLKLRHGSRSRVIAISNKDYAAVMMGGKLADAVYWVDRDRWVSSRYYLAALPAWVQRIDAKRPVMRYFGKTWDRLLAAPEYDAIQGADNVPGETVMFGLGRTFPKTIDGGSSTPGPDYFNAFKVAPFSTEILGQFAEAAIREERLGQHPDPDLLCLSFSQIDLMGHEYGPDSHEMMDSVLRLDRVLAHLFSLIDRQVGLEHCVIVLSADHGSGPLPEKLQALNRGLDAARFHGAALDLAVSTALDHAFGPVAPKDFWATRDNFGYTLHPSALAARHASLSDAEAVVKSVLLSSPEIAEAYSTDELEGPEPAGDTLVEMSRRSYYPGRSSDVAFILKPYVMDRSPYGINHGSPWDYDTHVPLVWYGVGVPKGVHPETVYTEDLAPTLAALLQIPRPPQARGRRLF